MSWKERPVSIEDWDESIDTVMAIDENGTTDLKGIRKKIFDHIFQPSKIDDSDNIFTITGVVLERQYFPIFKDAINSVKFAHWDDGIFKYKKGPKRVVFHSREIRKREGPFNPKIIDYNKFITDLSGFIESTPFVVYSSSIDKVEHILKYSNPYHVYNLCLEFIIERYCRYLRRFSKTGILLLESRGKKEDAQILKFLVEFLEKGNRYWSSDDLSRIKGVYFNPKWSIAHQSQASYILLELSDLVSYPIHKYVKTGTQDKSFDIIVKKMSNYPLVKGYGLKIFPEK